MTAHNVLVLVEPGRAGAAAVTAARELTAAGALEVTIVGVAPQASGPRCGPSNQDYNHAVIDTVEQEIAQAAAQLGDAGARARSRVIVEGLGPSLEHIVQAGNFDLILLPSRHQFLRRASHPAAAQVSARTRAEVRIVTPRLARAPGS
jgi:nucleotide-binding universal stress UspA family protein